MFNLESLNIYCNLNELQMSNTGITNISLTRLNLPNLFTLRISGTKTHLNDSVIFDMATGRVKPTFRKITGLDVSKTGVSDGELLAIAGLSDLTSLDLSDTTVTMKML